MDEILSSSDYILIQNENAFILIDGNARPCKLVDEYLEDQGLESARSPDFIPIVHLWSYTGRHKAALRCLHNPVIVPLRICDYCLRSGRDP
ncbi:hypothetical protein CEXT_491511 [Caerostris extrusa]|uniref:Uncharacterized protein n=1 Tax=Caerostris extrusa TaxID=172846 RepID=A0AAV4NAL8_CAEEX|nr:hypothetical protein CEXT_491511 [Caerostris extrusa]